MTGHDHTSTVPLRRLAGEAICLNVSSIRWTGGPVWPDHGPHLYLHARCCRGRGSDDAHRGPRMQSRLGHHRRRRTLASALRAGHCVDPQLGTVGGRLPILACPRACNASRNKPRNGISSLTGLCRPARRAHPPFGAARARSALAADYASPCARQLPTTSRISCSFLIL